MTHYIGAYTALQPNIAITGAVTLVQVNGPSDSSVDIIRAWATFNSTTSTQIEVGLKTVSTAGTATSVTAGVHYGPAFGGTCSRTSTAEGTLVDDDFPREFVNYLNGFLWLPVPEARIRLAPSARIALYLPTAPGASVNITAGIQFGELG
jgi:hypothetical protein